MSDLFGNHIVGFPTSPLKRKTTTTTLNSVFLIFHFFTTEKNRTNEYICINCLLTITKHLRHHWIHPQQNKQVFHFDEFCKNCDELKLWYQDSAYYIIFKSALLEYRMISSGVLFH